MINCKSPIFVLGAPRSGTTLMAKILGKHSSLFMPGETHFFPDIYARRDDLGNFDNGGPREKVMERLFSLYERYYEPQDQLRINRLIDEKRDFKVNLEKCSSYQDLFSTFMQSQAAYEGKERWGNNVPRDIFHLDEIISFYPDAKVILCIRDLRAFLLSYQGKWKITRKDHVERLKNLYHPVVTSLLWKSSMRMVPRVRDMVKKENIEIVFYENLVDNPDGVVRGICLKLGEKFEPNMLNITTNNSSHNTAGKGIFNASVSKWKTELSAEEIWISQKVGGKELRDFGYSIEPVNPNFTKVALIILGTPIALIRALKINRETSGPLIPYLRKRIILLFSGSQTN